MEDYTPNSHKFKAEQKESSSSGAKKKIEKVVKGPVKTKKKSELSKFADVFISEDVRNVKSYVLMDVLVPAVKKAISDIVKEGIDMILYGGTGRKSSTNSSYISYKQYSDKVNTNHNSTNSSQYLGYSHDDIILDTRGEAEEVLSRMAELIETYGVVSVADMYDLVGKDCNYTDNKYGWTNIRNAEPIRVRDGYMLKLPKAGPI